MPYEESNTLNFPYENDTAYKQYFFNRNLKSKWKTIINVNICYLHYINRIYFEIIYQESEEGTIIKNTSRNLSNESDPSLQQNK